VDLIERCRERLLRYVHRLLGCPHAAEDVVAEALVAVWRRREELPDEPERAVGWLYATARNMARNHVRGEVRRRRLLDRAAHLAAIEVRVDAHAHDEVGDRIVKLDAWRELSDVDREVLALVVAGSSYAEISEAVGVGPGGVGMRIMRARERLVAHVERN
jgi:RNA polymerase sigma-70 factor (ECF subfamily)